MDEIAKAIKVKNLGVYVQSLREKIGCLLWMDDVLLISTEPDEHQKLLDITYDIATRYRIVFGEEKSKTMVIGKTNDKPNFQLGEMILKYCDEYKYLGIIKNKLDNMCDQIKSTKGKVEAAYQAVLLIAGNRMFRNIEMKAIWELFESTITPTTMYGCETWDLTKAEENEINQILDNIIKRILITPQSTPREALYIKTGLLDSQELKINTK